MKKKEFLEELEKRLNGLPKNDIEERKNFYSEMIDDRVEDGKTEEEAIEDLGGIDTVVNQIASETPMVKLVKEKIKPKRGPKAWEIVLLVLGFPLWFPLLIVGFVLILVFYLLMWIFVIVTYVVETAFIVSAIAGFLKFGVELIIYNNFNIGYLSVGILGIGLALVMAGICTLATKLNVKLAKKIFTGFKRKMIGGGKNNE